MPKMIQQRQPSHEEIARLAYEFWEQNAKPAGRDVDFWLHAEQLLRSSARTPPQPDRSAGRSDPPREEAALAKAGVGPTPAPASNPVLRRGKKSTPLAPAPKGRVTSSLSDLGHG